MRLEFITRNTPMLFPRRTPTPWSPRMRGEIPSLVTISYTSSIDTSIIVSSKIVITNIASNKDNWKCHNFNWWYSRLGKALKWRVDFKLIQVITITKSYLKLITISNFHSAYSWNCLTSSCLWKSFYKTDFNMTNSIIEPELTNTSKPAKMH